MAVAEMMTMNAVTLTTTAVTLVVSASAAAAAQQKVQLQHSGKCSSGGDN
jgi:hypothetical protein